MMTTAAGFGYFVGSVVLGGTNTVPIGFWSGAALVVMTVLALYVLVSVGTSTNGDSPSDYGETAPPIVNGPPVDQGPSGLFSSTGITAVLFSGAALVITSAYLFVRSYWTSVPDALKFSGYSLLTALLLGLGLNLLHRGRIPKTAGTLIAVALFIVPFNGLAADRWILSGLLSPSQVVAWGAGLLLAFSLLVSQKIPTALLGIVTGLSLMSTLHFLALSLNLGDQLTLSIVSLGILSTVGILFTRDNVSSWTRGLQAAAQVAGLWVLGWLMLFHFYLPEPNQWTTVATLVMLGIGSVLQSRKVHPAFAHFAGALLLGAGALLLHQWARPVYTYGYFFIPAGMVALLRAWSFEREGRTALARPYFHWGQMAIAGSLLTVLPIFRQGAEAPLIPTLGVLMIAIAAYTAAGTLYRQSAYSYGGGLVGLLFVFTFTWGRGLDFASATLFFTLAACVFLVVGAVGAKADQEFVEGPFVLLGLATLTVAMALLAGRWGQDLFSTGRLIPDLPIEQARAGLWTGGLSVLAYGFLGGVKKKPAFLYPALLSATWVFVCFLGMNGIPITLVHGGWIVAGSMVFHYVFLAAGLPTWARSFSLWSEMIFAGMGIVAVVAAPTGAIAGVIVAGLAFLPGLFLKRSDLIQGILVSVYLGHNLLFRHFHPQFDFALYGLHLIPINCGVVFLRALVTLRRTDVPVLPFRIAAFVFSVLSLLLTLGNPHMAWQGFLAYGVLSLGVSLVLYEGRYFHVGGALLLLGAELFFLDQGIRRLELFLAPVGTCLFAIGYARRSNRSLRDFLYGFAIVLLYLPASVNALVGTWGWSGLFLALTSAILLVFGIHQKSRIVAIPSFVILLANAMLQSRGFFLSIPQEVYMGLGGLILLAVGGFFEFRRETVLKLKDKIADTWNMWD